MWPRVTHTYIFLLSYRTWNWNIAVHTPDACAYIEHTWMYCCMCTNTRSSTWCRKFLHILSNIRTSVHINSYISCFSIGLLCWQKSLQCSKLTAACLKIIVKKFKSLEAYGRKPHLRSQAVKNEPVKERKRSARERNQAHKSHSTACIIMTWSHKRSANESSQFLI